jgi:succinate dehydrogenase / fumarate reductase cytochrome b subunit
MSETVSFYGSSLGKKAVMAVSGIMLFGYVLLHMLGNLKLYQGPEKYNHYAEWLREVGAPLLPYSGLLWIVRMVLLAAVFLHMISAYQVWMMSRRARPEGYAYRDVVQATYASRTMRWGAVILGLFIFYHLAHLTFGWGWAHSDFVPGDVFHNVVAGFSIWWVSGLYIMAQLSLFFHLQHGLWSMFQSLGWDRPVENDWRPKFAWLFAAVITLGNISFPIAVLTGVVS